MQVLQIGRVAQRTGLSADTIRFYEKAGLLPRPARSSGGYRLYGEHAIADLEFIQKAQRLGFSLNEIRELFHLRILDDFRDSARPDNISIIRNRIILQLHQTAT